ncbi:MAG: radical SAM protein [Methanomethylophilus sp.]|jgi:DNA repair photolyase
MTDWFTVEDRDTRLDEFEKADLWDGPYESVQCRRALHPSGLPGIDYALNPYGGCEHGCIYCYAPEVTHTPWEQWRIVKVRVNIADRLVAELPGLTGTVGIGTVTDPYQGAEARFMLTRKCLEILKNRNFRIHLHTKSDLILRDIELLKHMRGEVGVTVTGLDEKGSKMLEPGAPLPERRLNAMKELAAAGIDVYALIGPVTNRLEGQEREFCEAVINTGVKRAVIDRLNLRPELSARLKKMGVTGSRKAQSEIAYILSENGLEVQDAFPSTQTRRF